MYAGVSSKTANLKDASVPMNPNAANAYSSIYNPSVWALIATIFIISARLYGVVLMISNLIYKMKSNHKISFKKPI